MKRICCIGAGNVAWHFATRWCRADYTITNVYSRTLSNALSLSEKVGARATDNIEKIDLRADVYFIALSDDGLRAIVKNLPELNANNQLILHCSGNVASAILADISDNYGVLYPFQSLKKNKEVFGDIPLCITAPNNAIQKEIENLAAPISKHQYQLTDDQRSILQFTGVLSNNFITHLIFQAEQLLDNANIDKALLQPILHHTIQSAINYSAYSSQTGPAIRNDEGTLRRHQEMIAKDQQLTQIYNTISQSIKKTYHEDS